MFDFALKWQPFQDAAVDAIGDIARSHPWNSMAVAVAYTTMAGVEQLCGELLAAWPSFLIAPKRFLAGLDFGLSEPEALAYLTSLPNTACHLYDAQNTLAAHLKPPTRFHPKVFAFGDGGSLGASAVVGGIVGSANLTGSGLTNNIEGYARFMVSNHTQAGQAWIVSLGQLEYAMASQSAADPSLLAAYAGIRSASPSGPPRAREPSVARPPAHGDLDPGTIRALRAASMFWTDTLAIVDNRHGVPGNQVDLRKGARAFFGSPVPLNAPVNTPLVVVPTETNAGVVPCAMRYGHNGMDKVNLPIPGTPGTPAAYDHMTIAWERRAGGLFRLIAPAPTQKLVAASQRSGTLFSYAGGSSRRWGFL